LQTVTVFILDDVHASLDNLNVTKVAEFIRFNGLIDPASVGLGYGSDTSAKKCLVGENDKTVVLQALEIEIRISSVSNVEFTEVSS
ncbi:hypothetical protein Tco_1567410, partial [Tanacetum coccineum]